MTQRCNPNCQWWLGYQGVPEHGRCTKTGKDYADHVMGITPMPNLNVQLGAVCRKKDTNAVSLPLFDDAQG